MGTFAELFKKKGADIPADKKEEFACRIEKLFRAGGMMELEPVKICDREARLLKEPSMGEHGMCFWYNYFEDNGWETAGFNRNDAYVWGGNVGWGHFKEVMAAAYTLEGLYTDGETFPMVDNVPVLSPAYTGWINYLFNEQYSLKRNDPWAIFEEFHDRGSKDPDDSFLIEFVDGLAGLISYYEVKAVQNGTDAADEWIEGMVDDEQKDDGSSQVRLSFFGCAKLFKAAIRKYHEKSELDEAAQLAQTMEMLRLYYEQDSPSLKGSREYEDPNFSYAQYFAALSDSPAYVVKAVAEIYGADFWELWEQVRGVAKKRFFVPEPNARQKYISNVSTADFLNLVPDDLIPLWDGEGRIRFSEELKEWFRELKKRYDEILPGSVIPENPLFHVMVLIQTVEQKTGNPYTFYDFFAETMEHLGDKRFMAL